MKFEEISHIINSRDMKAADEIASKILSCNDMAILKKLAENANEFIKLVSNIPKESENEHIRINLLQAANLINQISFGSCLCSSYRVRQCSPEYLQSLDSIIIRSENDDLELHETNYSCQCKFCKKNYNVSCVESGLFWEYIWKSST